METIHEINRIQSYLRESARKQYESVSLPPFTLFFHPSSALKYFNYAIPDRPVQGDVSAELAQLVDAFAERRRTPRFEFFEAFAPLLPDALLRHGFVEEARQWSMLCTPETLREPPRPPLLVVLELQAGSPTEDVRDFIIAQREGFDPQAPAHPTDNDIVQARLDFLVSGWQAVLGRVDGQPAAAASFNRAIDGVTEVAGIATRVPFRGLGIATYLTWLATRMAFDQGIATACLTAADEAAGRVYERVGFRPFSTMLAYIHEEPLP